MFSKSISTMLCGVFSLFLAFPQISFSSNSAWREHNNAIIYGAESHDEFQQSESNVSGTVFSEIGEPLVGVMVYIKGTATGVSTDLDGRYSIKAPEEGTSYVLVFQYIGTVTREITVRDQRVLNVTLMDDNELEGSVIVGAYGTRQSREDLVGSAFQVNASQIKDKPKARVDDLLKGLVPGMTIDPNADYAGTTRTRYETRIRGESSLSGSNEPLWIVDGVPVYTGENTNLVPGMSYTVSPLSYLDPSDIESITVLKDADQVTIYGANGSNGVILVTTKSGGRNTPLRVSANLNFGVSAPDYSTMFKMMNASQYMEVAREAWANAGYKASTFPYQDNDYNSYSTTSTSWPELYLGVGSDIYANVSLTSGTERVSNFVSGSFYRNNNIVKTDSQQRFSFRSRNVFTLARWLKLNTQLQASLNDNNLFPVSHEYLETLPIFEPYLPDGSYRLYNKYYSGSGFIMGKFHDNYIPDREESTNRQKSLKTSANFSMDAEILKGLTFTAQYSIDYTHSHEDIYKSRLTLRGHDSDGNPRGKSTRSDASYVSWTNIERLNFDRTFAGRHHVTLVAGLELDQTAVKTLYGAGSGFVNDRIQELYFADDESLDAGSSSDIRRTLSYFTRGIYSYDSRYYITANFRRDGNSDFAQYAQWANFWSVGFSWNIHNEKFFSSDIIRMLKLKASYGITGNSKVSASQAAGTYNYGPSYAYMGVAGAIIGSVQNPGLSWEKNHKLNIGARIELKDRFAMEVEFYNNVTTDLLSKIYTSRLVSPDRIYANVGSMLNRGVEMNISSTNIRSGSFRWGTVFNISHNTNRILELYNGVPTSLGERIWMEGYDANTWYLVEWAGVDPSDGSPMWYDLDGNLTKSYDTSNRKPGKSSSPLFTGGLMNEFSYGNWSLSFQINYDIGGWVLSSYANRFFKDGYNITEDNQAVEVYYCRWKTPGQLATFPKVNQISTKSGMWSTRFLYNKTSFQLSDLTLTYTFPARMLSKLKLQGLSLSFIGTNLYLLTPDQKKGFNSYKTMKYGYPLTRTFTLSANVSF